MSHEVRLADIRNNFGYISMIDFYLIGNCIGKTEILNLRSFYHLVKEEYYSKQCSIPINFSSDVYNNFYFIEDSVDDYIYRGLNILKIPEILKVITISADFTNAYYRVS